MREPMTPEQRRRYYVNFSIAIALAILMLNAGRLGRRGIAIVLVAALVLAVVGACALTVVRLARAKPRPAAGTLAAAATWIALFAYSIVGIYVALPFTAITFALATLSMLGFFIVNRRILFAKSQAIVTSSTPNER